MIDIRKYELFTPPISKFNLDSNITVYFRDGLIEEINKECDDVIDLREVVGLESKNFRLSFKNISIEYQREIMNREDTLQAFYYMLDFEESDIWVGVQQHNELSFFDAIYAEEEVAVEKSNIIV